MQRTSGMRRSLFPHFRRSLRVPGPAAAAAAVPAFFPGGAAFPGGGPAPTPAPELLRASSPALRERLSRSAAVFAAFVSPEEGAALLRDAEEALRRRRYEDGHWDGAISGFREAERSRWGAAGAAVLQRMSCAFPPARPPLPHSHILDLAPHGCVRPHIDSTKFCGCTIAGVSLLSAAVMRLRSVRDPREWAELLLEPLSLYVLR
ncbi:alpha-ketoglutarate-dependent dioxygenase alkB homolog 7, mitochondrial [Phasianus colchicus]|uniref:alpha-ketoglutarate-dependent dioxygenase alkB homolog 7, mitochondrial n=1 Tax=Phasianus colchicus TaxID=9054 RepID=UPI00129D9449|nr:alpha-ketoglutarate-dependent dioxygenase alkB homolog 7, mitochondrial [Phasianus colchicus]